MNASAVAERTVPPGHHVVLYDGLCKFCTAQAVRLGRWTRRDQVELVDFQVPGVLGRFPGLSHAACMEAMQVVAPDGRIFAGAAAVAQVFLTLRVVGGLGHLYDLPGLHWTLDRLYALIAARRYRIMGKEAGNCTGTCSLHLPPRS